MIFCILDDIFEDDTIARRGQIFWRGTGVRALRCVDEPCRY